VWSVCPCAPACGPCVSCDLCVPAPPAPRCLPVECTCLNLKARPELIALTGTITGFSGEDRFGVHMPEANTTLLGRIQGFEAASDEAVV